MLTKKIKVFIADDHEIFRDGVRQLISNESDMEVVGTASSGEEALELLKDNHADVVIMDIRMSGMNGLETSRAILKNDSNTHILFFSLYDRDDYVVTALEMGASGYILKDTSNKIFLKGIRAVSNGQFYFTGDVTDVLIKKYKELKDVKNTPEISSSSIQSSLSKREYQILNRIREGKTNKEIAEEYNLSVRTVETHRMNILRKFNVSNFDELIKNTDEVLGTEGNEE
ncbi:response regulator transcription factor [Cytophaga hutchinsonii]|jgi:two-component system response regulator DegU|uniref:Two-component response regulator n=1 Tax=Cytophaga hutchinsonii (strain ATCC 33406 / DSM 1761 / CIP 103989 / NBRC 15051 / NCIMB 9469 / D465) TaxID=269798 RepID=A0A6N4SQH5_CYTH3|nr:response regulator transcription factor [Cytophaga hutchinsonii]ABG58538.1 two-component response regulator [Cytophaga hutchinsonii ATCC 33406]SFX76512.1 two component transcriptional regulator, LuxR family [Cytophaga hutchinsonii ATCC 33406]